MINIDKCNICARNCNIDRTNSELGYCKSNDKIKLAKSYLHKWEEPCISLGEGSGTVFFSNCNLSCVFCQNHKISQEGFGKDISIEELSNIFLSLQDKKASNINLVTPTSYVPFIIKALDLAKLRGLNLPVLYNTNSYENIDTIKSLNGYIDVYLPDLKYFNDKYAIKYSNAPNYFNTATAAIEEMFNQVKTNIFNENGAVTKGLIIRHLMLPSLLFDSKKIIDYIYKTYGDNVYISIMNQYTPMYKSYLYPEINKNLNPKHYNALIDYAINLGVKNAFIQESSSSSLSYVPEFNLEGV
ncbi:MAG: radical SAM protein [Clostridiaceae bacterium]